MDPSPERRLRNALRIAERLRSLDQRRQERLAAARAAARGKKAQLWRLLAIGGAAALLAALVGLLPWRDGAPEAQPVQSTLLLPEGWEFAPASPFAVSPDGSRVAYVAVAGPGNEQAPVGSNSIWIRDLASPEPRQLASSDGDAFPFWSADGRWIGFFADGKLNKIDTRGGPVVPLCDATNGRGGSWNRDGEIIFQRAWSESLMRVSAAGGTPEPVTTLDKDRFEVAHRWPQFLPDGRRFLYYVVSTSNPANSEHSGIYLGSLDSNETRQLLRSESRALYAGGHLFYRVATTLMAHPFDASTGKLSGDPTPLASDIPGGDISWGGAQFGVSEAGVLVHLRGAGATRTVLGWRDRAGNPSEPLGELSGSRLGARLIQNWTAALDR